MKAKRAKLFYSAVVLAIPYLLFNTQDWLVRIPAYRHLYRGHPYYVPEGIKTSLQIVLCFAAVAFALGKDFRKTFAELRVDRGLGKGLLFGFIATLPFFIGLAATRHIGTLAWISISYRAFFAPFSEELVVRAYGFGQLHRRCGWPVWLAILPTAVLFGWGHVEKATNFNEGLAIFLLLTTGGFAFGWFYYRWDSIWFPWTMHALMNFYWEIFSVSNTALGGWFPFVLQNITLLLGIFITLRFTGRSAATTASV
jgi:membrane protease YdiL (CAAX protease family)